MTRFQLLSFVLAGLAATLPAAARTVDNRKDVRKAAVELAGQERKEVWSTRCNGRSADLITFLSESEVLVGEVLGGTTFGKAGYGDIQLLDLKTGKLIWSAKRESDIDATHTLLTRTPHLIFLTSHHKKSSLWAVDRKTGRRQWSYRLDENPMVQARDQRLVCVSGRSLEIIDAADGKRLAREKLSSAPQDLLVTDDLVLVAGSSVQGFSLEGQPKSTLPCKDLGDDLRLLPAAKHVLVWSDAGMTAIDADGKRQWTYLATPGFLRAAAATDKQVFLLLGSPDLLATDRLTAVPLNKGKPSFTINTGGRVTGPLTVHGGLVLFPLEDALTAFRTDRGRRAFRTEFPLDYAKANPLSIPLGGIPDEVVIYRDLCVIDRDGQGLRAFRLPSGKAAWSTPSFSNRATVALRYNELNGVLSGRAGGGATRSNPVPMVDWSGPQSSSIIRLQQQRHEMVMHDTQRVLRDRKSTASERRLAHNTRRHAIEADISRTQQQIAHERQMAEAQVALAAANAVVAIGQAFSKAYEQSIWDSLAARGRIQLRYAFRSRGALFQHGYHVTGFNDAEGSGIRLVDLSTGRLKELRYEPRDPLLFATRVPTEVYGLSPDGKRLIVIGLGLDHANYRTAQSRNFRLKIVGFQAAILCFDPTAPKPKPPKTAGKTATAAVGTKANRWLGKTKGMKQACMMGDTITVKKLLAAGADPNQRVLLSPPGARQKLETTPLRLAAAGHPEIVTMLLKAGAKPTLLNVPGLTAMDIASPMMDAAYPQWKQQRPEVRRLLKAAGAKPRKMLAGSKQPPGAKDLLLRQTTGAHLFLIRRRLQKPGWKQSSMVVAAVTANRSDIAQALLTKGVDPNAANHFKQTALHVAATRLNLGLVKDLLARGANADARDRNGSNPLTMMLNPYTPYQPKIRTIVELLLQKGADPNAKLGPLCRVGGLFKTPLQAATNIDKGLGKLLRKHGAK